MKSKILNTFQPFHRFVVLIFVIDIFTWMIANYSMYYLKNIEVFMDVLCFLIVVLRKELVADKYVHIAFKYLFACIFIILIPCVFWGELPFVSVVSKLLFAVSLISLKSNFKHAIYEKFLRYFTLLLFLGIIEWILLLFGRSFFWATVYRAQTQEFFQGVFILVPSYFVTGFYRFMSLCEEPGTLGTICFFLLITLDYSKYKKQFFILLISGLLSFSLGFYILISLWYFTQVKKVNFSQLLLGVISVVFMLTFFGDFFEERIIERVTEVDNIHSIDNRTNDVVDTKLKEISSDYRLLVGMGNRSFYTWENSVEGVSAGMKNFLFQYGLIGVLMIVISLSILMVRIHGYNKQTFLLIMFIVICLYKSNIWNYPPVLLSLLCVPHNLKNDNRVSFKNLSNSSLER